ncbi:MAG: transcriptional regulator [Wolbachia endosymbiont of Dactylopius coccus]|nr:MAG: transcriptional regulator [Wolbachia endosymbiont of Dactylopius coccus]
MPVAYSYDLRKKVMEALDEGESGETVAKRFKIGKTTLYEWKKRREKTGDFQSKKGTFKEVCQAEKKVIN